MSKIIVAFAICATITTSALAGVHSDFMKIWANREASYLAQRSEAENASKAAAQTATSAMVANDPSGPAKLSSSLATERAYAAVVGRGTTLHELRDHMQRKPSAAVTEAWIQGKTDELKTKIRNGDAEEQKVRSMKIGENGVTLTAWAGALEHAVQARGFVEGAVEEMSLIEHNLLSYYRGRGQEHAEAQAARAAIFRSIGNNLAAQQRNLQNWSATCSTTGIWTHCNGN